MATSPKSNSAYDAINAAIADVQAGRTGPIPRQLQNKHFDGEDAAVKGQNTSTPTILRTTGSSSSICRMCSRM